MSMIQIGVRKSRRRREPERRRDVSEPTPERFAKSANYDIADNGQTRVVRFKDDVIDRLHKLEELRRGNGLTKFQYDTAIKYRLHWHHGGLESKFSSIDLERVFGGTGGSFMPASEWQAHHRKQYRRARELLGPKLGLVADWMICQNLEAADVGANLGWRHATQGRAAAIEQLRTALDILGAMWGIP